VIASFYDEVLREILAALGAAMFVSRVLVLVRRGRHEQLVDVPAGPAPVGEVRTEDEPVDDAGDDAGGDEPAEADDEDDAALEDDAADEDDEVELRDEPLARTLLFLVLGFIVMVAGLASLAA
jgi:hypothetical protein